MHKKKLVETNQPTNRGCSTILPYNQDQINWRTSQFLIQPVEQASPV